jgi:hypothetical protein
MPPACAGLSSEAPLKVRHATVLHAIDSFAFRLCTSLGRVWFALLIGLALVGLALGSVGYHQLAASQNAGSSVADEFYQALQLFVLETPSPTPDIPLALELARYVAADLTADDEMNAQRVRS